MPACESCGRDTPAEDFCTWCGARRVGTVTRRGWRPAHFAAHPGQHLAQPSVVSTLFPHLPTHRSHEFRWALLGGTAVVLILVATGILIAAALAAAVLVPVLYLVYLYEAQVYRDQPARILASTIAAGAALGAATVVVAGLVIPASAPLQVAAASGAALAGTVLLPLIEEVVKPLPALLLRRQPQFNQTIDGLVFGVAVGLGFSAAGTVYDYSRLIGYEPLHTGSLDWLVPLLSAAVLAPVMQASCTGALTASLWRRGVRGRPRLLYAAGLPVALAGHVGFSFVGWLLLTGGTGQVVVLVWQAAVDVGLLVFVRFLLHRALLDEATDFDLQNGICPHCRAHGEMAAFCPHCGAAMSAGPRTIHGGLRSDPVPVDSPAAGG